MLSEEMEQEVLSGEDCDKALAYFAIGTVEELMSALLFCNPDPKASAGIVSETANMMATIQMERAKSNEADD